MYQGHYYVIRYAKIILEFVIPEENNKTAVFNEQHI